MVARQRCHHQRKLLYGLAINSAYLKQKLLSSNFSFTTTFKFAYLVENLRPGINYSFRVKAKNMTGWSAPSKGDVSVTLRPDFGIHSLLCPKSYFKPYTKTI